MNLPYFLHRSLTKMANSVQVEPSNIEGRLSHHSLIKLLVCQLLQRRNKEWAYFLFWNDFQTELQPENKKKFSTPKSRKRNNRAISPIPDDQSTPTSKPKKAKKKLNFDKEKGKEKLLQKTRIS